MNFKKIAKNTLFIFLCVVVLFLITTIIYLNRDKSFCEIKTIILAGLQRDGQSGVLLSNPDYIKSVCK
jgi:hypothetical protein